MRHLSSLDRKLLRDLVHIWPQALAIALVLSAGVATMILAVGARRSLEGTRTAYYERYRFGDLFAEMIRAPKSLELRLAEIPGVLAVESRIAKYAVVAVEGFDMPVTGRVLSIPDRRESRLNRLFLRAGRLPDPGRRSEVVVSDGFAKAHGLPLGGSFEAVLNGRRSRLTIVGLALSPEFVYAVSPGDLMPDERRFAVIWMPNEALAALYDLAGAFNSVSLSLLRGASEAAVIGELDRLTARYGGGGAFGRSEQVSHAFLDAELKQLAALARVIPPIFLFVSAFLINMTLSRLIALEREQIGLLKALGYGSTAIGFHYVKMVVVIAAVGVAIGLALGWRFGNGLTRLYGEFFHFPFLIFSRDPDIYVSAALLSVAAAVVGAARAVSGAVMLAPAVAMQPPAPARYRQLWGERLGLLRSFSQLTLMAIRHIARWPLRAAFTVLGVSLGVALLVVSLFSVDSIEHLIDVNFFLAQRQHATVTFIGERNIGALHRVDALPGVYTAEPFRSVPVRLRNGPRQRKMAITGLAPGSQLTRVIDSDLKPVPLPPDGLLIDSQVARLLAVGRGDFIDVESLSGRRLERRVQVVEVIESYFGLSAYMSLSSVNDMMEEGPLISGAHIAFDASAATALYAAVKSTPAIAGIGLQRVALAKFRETLARNVDTMTWIYAGLAVIVAFGVVYNSARIQLSEQARELASLRVLGFTRGEVSRVLIVEVMLLVLAAQVLGWLLGYGFAWLVIQGFSSDLYRSPFVVSPATFAKASLVSMVTALASMILVRRRIDRFDLVAVLKTRD